MAQHDRLPRTRRQWPPLLLGPDEELFRPPSGLRAWIGHSSLDLFSASPNVRAGKGWGEHASPEECSIWLRGEMGAIRVLPQTWTARRRRMQLVYMLYRSDAQEDGCFGSHCNLWRRQGSAHLILPSSSKRRSFLFRSSRVLQPGPERRASVVWQSPCCWKHVVTLNIRHMHDICHAGQYNWNCTDIIDTQRRWTQFISYFYL